MRFLSTPHTIVEYKHQKMPVFETLVAVGTSAAVGLGASAATAATVGGVAGALGTAALGAGVSYGASKLMGGSKGGGGGGGGGMPTYNDWQIQQDAKKYADLAQKAADSSQQYVDYGKQNVEFAKGYIPTTESYSASRNQLFGSLPFQQTEQGIYNRAAQAGVDFSRMGTQANIANQEAATPGSYAQRQLAQNAINDYIQGRVPTDVQQNTQRAIAQSFGGGYNPFNGGGQAPSAFARNIGQTSVGLSQFGLSAAPTWQQLANSMVVSPQVGMGASLQANQLANSQVFGVAQQAANQVNSASGYGMNVAGLGMNAAGLGMQKSELGLKAANIGLGALGIGMQGAENTYESGLNQYKANQIQGQQNQQMLMQGANSGLGIFKDYMKGAYTSQIPSYMGYGNTGMTSSQYSNSLGYSPGETPSFGTE